MSQVLLSVSQNSERHRGLPSHPEGPRRVNDVYSAIRDAGLLVQLAVYEATELAPEALSVSINLHDTTPPYAIQSLCMMSHIEPKFKTFAAEAKEPTSRLK